MLLPMGKVRQGKGGASYRTPSVTVEVGGEMAIRRILGIYIVFTFQIGSINFACAASRFEDLMLDHG